VSEYLDKLKSLQLGKGTSGPTEGRTVQLPRNYKYAKKHDKDGTVVWTTPQEARDIAKRATDGEEQEINFDG
jgi:hypothetical protein